LDKYTHYYFTLFGFLKEGTGEGGKEGAMCTKQEAGGTSIPLETFRAFPFRRDEVSLAFVNPVSQIGGKSDTEQLQIDTPSIEDELLVKGNELTWTTAGGNVVRKKYKFERPVQQATWCDFGELGDDEWGAKSGKPGATPRPSKGMSICVLLHPDRLSIQTVNGITHEVTLPCSARKLWLLPGLPGLLVERETFDTSSDSSAILHQTPLQPSGNGTGDNSSALRSQFDRSGLANSPSLTPIAMETEDENQPAGGGITPPPLAHSLLNQTNTEGGAGVPMFFSLSHPLEETKPIAKCTKGMTTSEWIEDGEFFGPMDKLLFTAVEPPILLTLNRDAMRYVTIVTPSPPCHFHSRYFHHHFYCWLPTPGVVFCC
jgi:hypothetical protein